MKKLLILLLMACSFNIIANTSSSTTGGPTLTECGDQNDGNRTPGKATDSTTTDVEETSTSNGDSQ